MVSEGRSVVNGAMQGWSFKAERRAMLVSWTKGLSGKDGRAWLIQHQLRVCDEPSSVSLASYVETTRPPESALLESSLAPSLMQERLALVCTDHDTLNETWWCLTNLPNQSRANRQNECESASSCVLLWTDILWTDGIVHVLNGADPSIARCTPILLATLRQQRIRRITNHALTPCLAIGRGGISCKSPCG